MTISPSLVLSRTYSALEAPSRRVRSAATAAHLHELAARIKCFTLQGDVAFDGAEFVVRNLIRLAPEADSFILDMNRVSHLTDSAATLFHDVRSRLWRTGKALVYSRIRGKPAIEDALRRTLAGDDRGFLSFEDNDVATEWCENRLLETEMGATVLPLSIKTLADFPMFADMPGTTLSQLERLVEAVDFDPGAVIIAAGQSQDDRVFFIIEGEVSVVLTLDDGSHQRIATLSRGMSFGEMALLGGGVRSASVYADGPVRTWTLRASALDELAAVRPALLIKLLKNLSRDLAQKLRKANQLIVALAA